MGGESEAPGCGVGGKSHFKKQVADLPALKENGEVRTRIDPKEATLERAGPQESRLSWGQAEAS